MGDVLSVDFNLQMPLLKAQEEVHHGERVRFVSGLASLEVEDQQKETIVQKGIDFQPFLETGYINWDHGDIRRGSPAYLIGEPTSAEIRESGGVPAFYIEGFLYNDKPMADEAWNHLIATSKSLSTRKMGWSIQGHTMAATNGKILKSVVRDVAMTHKPVLKQTTVSFQEIYKSLAVDSEDNLRFTKSILLKTAEAAGNLAPVRTEDLHGARRGAGRRNPMKGKQLQAVMEAIYGPGHKCKSEQHYNEQGQFYKGSIGALDHMVGCLGWSVQDAEPIIRTLRGAFRD